MKRPTIRKGDMVRYEFRRADGTKAIAALRYAFADEKDNRIPVGAGLTCNTNSVREVWRMTTPKTYVLIWKQEPAGEKAPVTTAENNLIKLENLGLKEATYNRLRRAGINSTGALLHFTAVELKQLNGVGPTTVCDVKTRLKEKGLCLKGEDEKQ